MVRMMYVSGGYWLVSTLADLLILPAPVFKLLRAILRFFAQQVRHIAPMAVKFNTEESSMPNFTPIGATIRI